MNKPAAITHSIIHRLNKIGEKNLIDCKEIIRKNLTATQLKQELIHTIDKLVKKEAVADKMVLQLYIVLKETIGLKKLD
jgi:hypothetical protein